MTLKMTLRICKILSKPSLQPWNKNNFKWVKLFCNYYSSFKDTVCSFWQDILIRCNQTHFFVFNDWINKLTVKDNIISYYFSLLMCGGPCHLSSFKQCSGTLLKSLFMQFGKGKYFMNFCSYLIFIVNINILSLNYFSKTTQCPFKCFNPWFEKFDLVEAAKSPNFHKVMQREHICHTVLRHSIIEDSNIIIRGKLGI